MNILDKYISKQVLLSILLTAFALLGIDLFFIMVNELRFVAKTHYTIANTFSYIALTAPTRLYIIFPWSVLIGVLISLGSLANHSELVVMRAAGVSPQRLIWTIIKGTFILVLAVIFIGEGIAPGVERIAEEKRTVVLSKGQSINTPYGLWIRQGTEFIHVQSVGSNQELHGITRYQFGSDNKLKEVNYAEKATPKGNTWLLEDIHGTRLSEDKTETFEQKEQTVKNLLDPEILQTATVRHPERLSLPILYRIIEQREKNELNARTYALAFWTKIFHPLVIWIMIFLAVPFVFGPLRSVSMGFRIVAGLLVSFTFYTVNGLLAPLAVVYRVPPVMAALTPILLFAMVAIWLLRRNSFPVRRSVVRG